MDSVDWLWIGGSNQFASWIHVRDFYLVYRAGETIYSAEYLHETENKINEGIKEKNNSNLLLHGLILVLKYVVLTKGNVVFFNVDCLDVS